MIYKTELIIYYSIKLKFYNVLNNTIYIELVIYTLYLL